MRELKFVTFQERSTILCCQSVFSVRLPSPLFHGGSYGTGH